MNRASSLAVLVSVVAFAPTASGQDASTADAPWDGADSEAGAAIDATAQSDAGGEEDAKEGGQLVWASCMEHLPEGVTRPGLTNTFPKRGLAGYALPLVIRIEHGLGEKVLPNGFRIAGDSDAARALAAEGFVLPSPDGGAGPSLEVREQDGKGLTEVVIHFVALPEKPGRHELTLPPIPIAVSRASGEMLTVCTTPHTITIDEPIADEPQASPKDNPPPRPQREVWYLARDLTYGLLVGAVVAAVLTWLAMKWVRRPRPLPPPPPPRPPWETAFASLDEIRRENLPAQGKRSEHMDRVSDVVRIYLGARYGFDGIESTTDEVLQAMGRVEVPTSIREELRTLLQDSDLVKFARLAPTDMDCEQVLASAERIVRGTMPLIGVSSAAPVADVDLGGGNR